MTSDEVSRWDSVEWKLLKIDPLDGRAWRTDVKTVRRGASRLPCRGPTEAYHANQKDPQVIFLYFIDNHIAIQYKYSQIHNPYPTKTLIENTKNKNNTPQMMMMMSVLVVLVVVVVVVVHFHVYRRAKCLSSILYGRHV
jgi:hypothetical protein